MTEILIATDGSEDAMRALDAAIELAAATGDSLVAVAVWQIPPGEFGIPYGGYVGPDVWDAYRAHADTAVQQAAERARAAGVETDPVVLEGAPAPAIVDFAKERRVRMIVVGTHGWGSVKGALFGSVSRGVLHRATCPVVVVPPPREPK
jgi:nucleotide-binding universal stress UspA family protein